MRQIYSSFVLNGQVIPNPLADAFFHPGFANDDGLLARVRESRQHDNEGLPEECRETALKVCGAEPWGKHFHAWLGHSEKRYIFSVFPLDSQQPLAGLPEFSQAIALAVAYHQSGRRICQSLFPFSWEGGVFMGSERPVEAAIIGGAREWHVHLLARTLSERRAILDDLRDIPKHSSDFPALLESERARRLSHSRREFRQ